jgi:hypothetical protein
MGKLRIVTVGISGWGGRSHGRFATPADSARHECSPYRGLHVRRESVGCVHRSRAFLCRARAKPLTFRFATFCVALSSGGDEKVANRDIRIWHFVIENGY